MARGSRGGQPPEQLARAGRRRGRAWKRLHPGTGSWGPFDQSSEEAENQKSFGSRKRREGRVMSEGPGPASQPPVKMTVCV